jgi:hypothetical protein
MALVGIGIGISMPHVNVVMATLIPPRSVGRAALRQVLHDQGITLSEALLKRVLNTVHKTASLHKRPLSPREVRELALVCQKNSSRAQPGVCEANKADSPLWRHPLTPAHVSANPIG